MKSSEKKTNRELRKFGLDDAGECAVYCRHLHFDDTDFLSRYNTDGSTVEIVEKRPVAFEI